MSKYNERRIPYATQDRLMNKFCQTLSDLDSQQNIFKFLKDLLNRNERMMLVRRLLIAELLEKKWKYCEIKKHLKCGGATIARVHRALSFGREGYKTAIRSSAKKKNA